MLRPTIAHLTHRSVYQIHGPDAQKFLKGQSCKDVEPLRGGYSGFLNATGRVLHALFIVPSASDSYLLIHDSNHPNPLHSLLPPFKLRSKVRLKDVSDQWDVWASWGLTEDGPRPSRQWKMGSGGAEAHWSWEGQVRDLGLSDKEYGCWDLRARFEGRQLIVPKGMKPSLSTSHDVTSVEDYHLWRMQLGIPEGAEEIVPGSALPMESCMDLHGGVDFRKGCYVGQELTVRTYHTGVTRKRILPIRVADGFVGEIIYHPPADAASQKPRTAGRIIASRGELGLGLVRLEYAERACWTNQPVGRLTACDSEVMVGKGEAYENAYGDAS